MVSLEIFEAVYFSKSIKFEEQVFLIQIPIEFGPETLEPSSKTKMY